MLYKGISSHRPGDSEVITQTKAGQDDRVRLAKLLSSMVDPSMGISSDEKI